MKLRLLFTYIFVTIINLGCYQNSENIATKVSFEKYLGDYVTDDYKNRAEGYDWVAVSLDTIR